MKVFIILMALAVCADSSITQGMKIKVRKDEYLIVPGVGAESVILQDKKFDIRSILGQEKYTISQTQRLFDIFIDVLGVKGLPSVSFNCIYFVENKSVMYFIENDHVVAIAGLRCNRVTIDLVELHRGVRHVLSRYNQTRMVKNEIKGNVIFVFPEIGFAIADDNNDNVIDFYIVFSKIIT